MIYFSVLAHIVIKKKTKVFYRLGCRDVCATEVEGGIVSVEIERFIAKDNKISFLFVEIEVIFG